MGEVRTRVLAGVVLVIVAISVLTAGAAASTTGWWYVHGTAANAENLGGVVVATMRLPNAYTVVLMPGATDGVQIAVPSHFESTVAVKRIFAEFNTSTPTVLVNAIEVWNGSVLVKGFTGPWTGPNALNLALANKTKFNRGMMLRFIIFNADPANQQFRLSSVGARFVPYP